MSTSLLPTAAERVANNIDTLLLNNAKSITNFSNVLTNFLTAQKADDGKTLLTQADITTARPRLANLPQLQAALQAVLALLPVATATQAATAPSAVTTMASIPTPAAQPSKTS